MSKSPLAGAFAEGSTPEKKKNKKGAALLIIAGIGLTASVGGVFAANNITINGGNTVQFGQGIATTVTCVEQLSTTVSQDYRTVAGTDDFYAESVVVGGDFTACAGKTLKVDLREDDGDSLHSFSFQVVASNATSPNINASDSTKTENVNSANVVAGSVKKVTVTTE